MSWPGHTLAAMTKPSKRRRSELERLVDLTVLGPTHPELGTCWLFTGTTTPYGRAENQRHLRKTHCKHGHPLSGGNLRIGPNGTRACRACNAAAQQAFRERSSARPS